MADLMNNADKLSFMLSEFTAFRNVQKEMRSDVKVIYEILHVKRDGKPGLCQQVDTNTTSLQKITTIMDKNNNRIWDVTKTLFASIIGAVITLIFYLAFYAN